MQGRTEEAWQETEGHQALPVATGNHHATGPPTTGEEYLRRVRLEREAIPEAACTAAAYVPHLHQPSAHTTHTHPLLAQVVDVGAEAQGKAQAAAVSDAWRTGLVDWFSDLRIAVLRWTKATARPLPLPHRHDKQAWLRLMALQAVQGKAKGRDEATHCTAQGCDQQALNDDRKEDRSDQQEDRSDQQDGTKGDQQEDRSDQQEDRSDQQDDTKGDQQEDRSRSKRWPDTRSDEPTTDTCGHVWPSLSLITSLSQPLVLTLLAYHTDAMRQHGHVVTEAQCGWLFALLAKLDRLLTAEEVAGLRALCRQCWVHRCRVARVDHAMDQGTPDQGTHANQGAHANQGTDQADNHGQRLAWFDVLITIIARYFGQRDLA